MNVKDLFVPKKLNNLNAVDDHLEKILSRKDHRKLYALIRSSTPINYNYFIDYKDDKWAKNNVNFENTEQIYSYYNKADVNSDIGYIHWKFYRNIQQQVNKQYSKKTKLPRQDNKTYINKGNGWGTSGKIRYPSKKRKTAWKRFYKLFPDLDPNNEDPIEKFNREKKEKEILQQKINESVRKSKNKK